MSSRNRENLEGAWNNLFNKQFQLRPWYSEDSDNINNIDSNTCGISSIDADIKQTKHGSNYALETQAESLQWLKTELNMTKSSLNDYDITVWRNHTSFANLCSNLSRFVKKKINPELCTQAWLKFFTIINTYDIITSYSKDGSDKFASLHLCEAPGAFITCLNHHILKKHAGLEWKWIATTLNPYYEGNDVGIMINDDRFIKETFQNWEFGADFSGNIMDINNLTRLKERSEDLGKINLVFISNKFGIYFK